MLAIATWGSMRSMVRSSSRSSISHLQLIQLLLYLGIMLEVTELQAPTAVGAGAALCVALLCIKPAGRAYHHTSACIADAPASAACLLISDAAAAGRQLTAVLIAMTAKPTTVFVCLLGCLSCKLLGTTNSCACAWDALLTICGHSSE
jgi:hypothetical protein